SQAGSVSAQASGQWGEGSPVPACRVRQADYPAVACARGRGRWRRCIKVKQPLPRGPYAGDVGGWSETGYVPVVVSATTFGGNSEGKEISIPCRASSKASECSCSDVESGWVWARWFNQAW